MRSSHTGPRLALASLLTALTVALPVGAGALPPTGGPAAPASPTSTATLTTSAAGHPADERTAADESSAAGHSRRTLTIAAAVGILLGAGALAAGLALGFPRRALTEGLQRSDDRTDDVAGEDPPGQG